MVFRFLFRYIANNEQLIQRMAESYPMRRAAQLIVSAMYRAKGLARERGWEDSHSKRLKSLLESLEEKLKETKPGDPKK